MRPYGRTHKIAAGKIHPANECPICAERKPPQKRTERSRAKKLIKEEVDDLK